MLPVTLGAAVQEPCVSLSKVGVREFGSAEGEVAVLHLPVRDADELNHGGHLSSSRYFICASPSAARLLRAGRGHRPDGGAYAPPLFELIAVLGNKPLDGGREVNVSHRIAPVAKSTQAGPDK